MKQKGFTLVELMVVLAILAIVSYAGIQVLAGGSTRFSLTTDVNYSEVKSVMVIADKSGNSFYKAIKKNGDVVRISEKTFGKLVADGATVIDK